ncbi:MAG: hypothetical protein LBO66_08610 [Deltaproteobacteria bacterium]|nr:hypothetical protein [Deltaproteobacteria bacterium]
MSLTRATPPSGFWVSPRRESPRPPLWALALAWLSLAFLPGCLSPHAPLAHPEIPDFKERTVILVFERENSFRPLSGALVTVSVSSPARLLSPAGGVGRSGPDGSLAVVYAPALFYDLSAAQEGDVVADFPALLFVTLDAGGDEIIEFEVDDSLSFARYQDPLYQGLNRDPSPGPTYVNLAVPY